MIKLKKEGYPTQSNLTVPKGTHHHPPLPSPLPAPGPAAPAPAAPGEENNMMISKTKNTKHPE